MIYSFFLAVSFSDNVLMKSPLENCLKFELLLENTFRYKNNSVFFTFIYFVCVCTGACIRQQDCGGQLAKICSLLSPCVSQGLNSQPVPLSTELTHRPSLGLGSSFLGKFSVKDVGSF